MAMADEDHPGRRPDDEEGFPEDDPGWPDDDANDPSDDEGDTSYRQYPPTEPPLIFPQYDKGGVMPGTWPAGHPLNEPAKNAQPRQIIAPPGRFKVLVYSLGFYVFVMASIAAGTWWSWYKLGSPGPLRGVAIGITVVLALLCLLRLGRGSVLEAERIFEEKLEEKSRAARETSAGGFPVLEVISHRIGRNLDRTPGKPPERVVWEGQQHFLSVFSIAARRFTASNWRRKVSGWYFKIFFVLVAASVFFSAKGDEANIVPRLNALIGLLSLGLLAYLVFGLWEWRLNRYAITDKRLLGVTGVLGRDVGAMPNNRFTDAKVSVSAVAHLFEWLRIVKLAWATWDVENAGQDQALKYIRFVPAGDIIAPFYSLGDTR